jgi:hypothetical protein
MPLKRRLSKQREHVVDHEALALFERGLQLLHARRHWSDEHRRDYSSAARDLDRALGVKLWATPVLDTIGLDQPPQWMIHELERSCWHGSKQIEQQLRQALARVVPTMCWPQI